MSNWLDEAAEEAAQATRKAWDETQTPEALARAAERKAREFDLGVREGWWNAEGEALPQPEDEEEEEDDDSHV